MAALPLRTPTGLWNLERLTGEPRLAVGLAEAFATWEELAMSSPAQRWTRAGSWAVPLVVPRFPNPVPDCPGRWAVTRFDPTWPSALVDDPDVAAVLWGFGPWPSAPLVTIVAGTYPTPEGRFRSAAAAAAVRAEKAALVVPADGPLALQADVLVVATDPTRSGPAQAAVRRVLERGGCVVWVGGPGASGGAAAAARAERVTVTLSEAVVVADVAPHPDGGGAGAAAALRLGRPLVSLLADDGPALVEALHRSLAGDRDWAHRILDTDPQPGSRGDLRLAAAIASQLRR